MMKRNKIITFFLSEDELGTLDERARAVQSNRSDYIRKSIFCEDCIVSSKTTRQSDMVSALHDEIISLLEFSGTLSEISRNIDSALDSGLPEGQLDMLMRIIVRSDNILMNINDILNKLRYADKSI